MLDELLKNTVAAVALLVVVLALTGAPNTPLPQH